MALLVVSRLAAAQDNLVVNGSFNGNANGWVITNTPGGFGYHSAVGNPPGGVQLDNVSPSTSSDPSASQTISGLTPGIVYRVSGDYRRGKVRGSALPTDQPSFGVAIDGNFPFTTLAPAIPFEWLHFSFSYTASSSAVFLSVSSQLNGTGVSYDIDNIAMAVQPILYGDYNSDGKVDAADYARWRKGGPLLNEVDTPGTVNAADYTEWRAHFGNSSAGSGGGFVVSVPEPSTFVLAVGICAALLTRRRKSVPHNRP